MQWPKFIWKIVLKDKKFDLVLLENKLKENVLPIKILTLLISHYPPRKPLTTPTPLWKPPSFPTIFPAYLHPLPYCHASPPTWSSSCLFFNSRMHSFTLIPMCGSSRGFVTHFVPLLRICQCVVTHQGELVTHLSVCWIFGVFLPNHSSNLQGHFHQFLKLPQN